MKDDEEKPIHLKKSGEEDGVIMLQEATILSQLNHTNILKFYGILKDDLYVSFYYILNLCLVYIMMLGNY